MLTLMLLSPTPAVGQEPGLPDFVFNQESAEISTYYSQLKIKDQEALIVKIKSGSYWSERTYSYFIVYSPDGKIRLFKTYESRKGKLEIVKKKRLSTSKSRAFQLLLDSTLYPLVPRIDESQLNINSKPLDDGRSQVLHISDGTSYHLQIIQERGFTEFSTYNPYSFIEAEYPGHEHRQRMMEIIEKYYKLIRPE